MDRVYQEVIKFVKIQYEEFYPFWKWTILPKHEKKQKLSYHQILSACRVSQYGLIAVAVLLVFISDNFRESLQSTTFRDGAVLILVEVAAWIFLAYVLGEKRIPPNYIPVAIMKAFAAFDKDYKLQVQNFQLQVLQNTRPDEKLYALTYDNNQEGKVNFSPIRNIVLLFVFLAITYVISKYTKVNLSNHENFALITTSVASSSGAVLLITSACLKDYPSIREFHKRWCERWIVFAVSVFIFVLIFQFQRLRLGFLGKVKLFQNNRMQFESVLFILSLYILSRYLPVIHKGFQIREILSFKKVYIVAETFTPTLIADTLQKIQTYTGKIMENTVENNAKYYK